MNVDSPDSPSVSLPLALARRVDAQCQQFEAAWKDRPAGGPLPRLEDYLVELPRPGRTVLLQELLRIEAHHRRQAGEEPRAEEYLPRFPDLPRGRLEALLAPASAASDSQTIPTSRRARSPESPSPGDVPHLPGYEVLGELGRGGMGIVYKARQLRLNRLVALKVIKQGHDAGPREKWRHRLEAEAAAQLHHPHIVQIYDVGEHAGRPYLALEYVAGGSLDKYLTGTPQPVRAAAQLVEVLARTVHYAHERGIVHRDLKPANILLERKPSADYADYAEKKARPSSSLLESVKSVKSVDEFFPKITDFGLAKLLRDAVGPTMTGDVIGTPSYMAPEQAAGEGGPAAPAIDVYGLGALLYELLTGRPPFRAESQMATLFQVRFQEPVSPSQLRPNCPRDLVTICLKCLHKEPSRRYATAQALADDLHSFLAGQPIQARPVGIAERAWRWGRKHPGTAGLLGLVALVVMFAYAGITWYAFNAEERRKEAETSRQVAQRALEAADAATYYQRVSRAYREWQACNLEQAEELLRPYAANPQPPWEWRYVHGLCNSELLTLERQPDAVTCVQYSPDGRWLATATGGWYSTTPGQVKLWDAATGRLVRTFPGQLRPVMDLAFDPSGRILAAGCVGFRTTIFGGVHLWDVDSGRELDPFLANLDDVFCIAFSPDGTLLASGSGAGHVRLWDLATHEELVDLGTYSRVNVFGVTFSPDGRFLVSSGMDANIRVWDVAARKWLHTMNGMSDVRRVQFSSNGRYLAAANWARIVQVWDMERKERQIVHEFHQADITCVVYHPDGWLLASADSSGLVQIYNPLLYLPPRSVMGHTGRVNGLAFSPDGTRLATAGNDGLVKVWDVTRYQEYRTLGAHDPWYSCLAYSPDGRWLVTAGHEGPWGMTEALNQIAIWNVEKQAWVRSLPGHAGGVTSVSYRADGSLLASGGRDRTIRLWDPATGQLLAALTGHRAGVRGVAFHPAGKLLASAGADGTLRLWDVATAEEVYELAGPAGEAEQLAFSPDGNLLAAAGSDHTVRVWSVTGRQLLASWPAHAVRITALTFSPDSTRLATASEDKLVALWEPATRREVWRSSGHTRTVTALAFSPDGRRLASAGHDWTVKLWDVATGTEAFTLRGAVGPVLSVAFRPDGRQIAAGARDQSDVKLWDVEDSPEERRARAAQVALPWHQARANAGEGWRDWHSATFHLGKLLEATPGDMTLLRRRAHALTEEGRWDEAEADYARVSAANPGDLPVLYCLAMLRLRAGDRAGFRAAWQKLHDHCDQPLTADWANTLAWLGAVRPDSGIDVRPLISLAERATRDGSPSNNFNTLGAVWYRAGEPEKAIAALERAIEREGKGGTLHDWLFLAMAHARKGDPVAAQSWLDRATRKLDEVPSLSSFGSPTSWVDRLEWQWLRAEAEACVKGAKK